MSERYAFDTDDDPIHVVDVPGLLAGRDVIPLRVSICLGCGCVVGDKGFHDRVCVAVQPEDVS